MKEFKHTPGPWQFLFGYTPNTCPEYTTAPEHGGWKFKTIDIGSSDDNKITQLSGYPPNYGEFEANAKLISASPDMIEEINTNHEFLLRLYNSINTYGSAVNFDEILQSLRDRMTKQLSIIEKATK